MRSGTGAGLRSGLAAAMAAAALTVALSLDAGTAAAAYAATPDPPADVAVTADAPRGAARLELAAPASAGLGDRVTLQARLTTSNGAPVQDAVVVFTSAAAWGELVNGEMELGRDRTDSQGTARVVVAMRRTGSIEIVARFPGNDVLEPVAGQTATVQVTGNAQLYTPEVGVRVPGLGGWLIALTVATVWLLYLSVVVRLALIARAGVRAAPSASTGAIGRRRFVSRLAVPAALGAFVVTLGGVLPTIIARSPRTHGNLRNYLTHSRYQRSPFAPVGQRAAPRPMPPVLPAPVSFERDVRPILLRRGGPHAIAPKSSPPPAGVRFDSYRAIMAREGLVVPGRPQDSAIVKVLLDPAMNMPPSMPPLPDGEVQVIVSWIAQGASEK